ncbi:MAG: hypothetical protein MRY64_01865 [Hyphomonadaceae bacterium]|nr:hypothetical protein [Hyphomonadaceae bacterium]
MSPRRVLLASSAIVVSFAVAACGGDPEEKSAAELEKAYETWTDAKADSRLTRRLNGYEQAIETAENVLERYPETEAGERLARYGAWSGVDMEAWRTAHDDLADKLPCIEKPDAACLADYAISPAGEGSTPRSRNGEIQPAVNAACTGDAQGARAALSKFQANGQAYRTNLIQTAMMAADCGEDGVVADLVATAVDSDNATGQMRVQNLAQILATPRLRPGWAHTADAMLTHIEASNLPEQIAANGLFAAMPAYAGAGQPDKALAIHRQVAGEMGYRVNVNDTVVELLANGGAEIALAEPFRQTTLGNHNTDMFARALLQVMADAGLTGVTDHERATGRFASRPAYALRSDPQDVLVPITDPVRRAALKARLEDFQLAITAAIQAGEGNPINSITFQEAQYLIALIYLRLGEPETAASLVEAAADIPSSRRNGQNYTPPYDVTYWLATGDLDAALEATRRNIGMVNERVAQEFGQAGRASEAQAVIGHLLNASMQTGNQPSLSLSFAEGLIEAGQPGDAMPMIVSLRGEYRNSAHSDRVFLALVSALAAQGDISSLEALDVPSTTGARSEDQIAFLAAKAEGLIKRGNDAEIRTALEALYAYAETAEPSQGDSTLRILQSTGTFGANRAFLMEPARVALEGGLIDLGLDYYERGGRWNSAPLVAAAKTTTSQADRTRLLTAAYDTSDDAFAATAWGILQSLGES